jgi:hypothetical protein
MHNLGHKMKITIYCYIIIILILLLLLLYIIITGTLYYSYAGLICSLHHPCAEITNGREERLHSCNDDVTDITKIISHSHVRTVRQLTLWQKPSETVRTLGILRYL